MEPNVHSELIFECDEERVVCSDVVTGEVWLAGGQSNMEHPTFCTEYDENDLVDDADIRLFTVPRLTFYKGDTYGFHFECLHSVDTPWKTCTVDEALHFTAIGYFFAHKLKQNLDIPIGIISCNWGATPIESWTSEEYLLRDPLACRATDAKRDEIEKEGLDNLISRYTDYQAALKEFCKSYDAMAFTREQGVAWFLRHAGEGQPPLPMDISFYRFPSALRENMLERIVPYSFRGVIWHQGESNTSAEVDSKEHYLALYRAMMADWRDAFKNAEMPFYLVQIAGVAWHGDNADYWTGVRDAQKALMDEEKNVYMTVSYDLSEPDNIHPAKKQPMGERLAAAALANTYGQNIVWKCPEAVSASLEGNTVRINCTDVSVWHTLDGKEIEGFYIVNRNGERVKADAKADGGDIILSIPDGETADAVEYSRLNYSYTNLWNELDLPLTPFKITL
ncbi:MAG: hypothetical protein J6L83_03650 [Clostridia bacterium]|nr:hypothetical protein [Clostridia bacterium]